MAALRALDYLSLHLKPLLQSRNCHLKLARLDHRFIIGADKGKIIRAQAERQRATLARFQINLRETFQPFSGGRERCNQIAEIELDDFLACSGSAIGYRNAD